MGNVFFAYNSAIYSPIEMKLFIRNRDTSITNYCPLQVYDNSTIIPRNGKNWGRGT